MSSSWRSLGIALVSIVALTGLMAAILSRQNPLATTSVAAATVEEFTQTVQNKVVAELGQPIEGFEPTMFLQVYPGMMEQDFDGVDALIGGYVYRDDALVHDLFGEPELHSAARAISPEGMETLLFNIAQRVHVDLTGEGVVTDIIDRLETPHDGSPRMIEGEITCLPPAAKSGPVTLECALGLRATTGAHYALDTQRLPTPELFTLPTGTRVAVTGVITPIEALSTDHWQKYDIVGIIQALKLVPL